MQTLFFTLIAFVAIILLMSIGFIIKKQSLKGSCGGLSTLGIAKACDCDKPCDTLQSKLDAGDKQAKAEYEQKFAKKDGVKSTKDGLLYKITEAGKGEAIKATDTVKVHYTGKLPDGKVFDSSVERGQPVEFKLNQVIKGWTEGLQLVKKGGKIELVIPPELAYGKQGAGDAIPPDATLYFDVEVLDVNPKK